MHRAIVLELKRFRIAVHLGKVLFAQRDPTRTGKTVHKRLGQRLLFHQAKGKPFSNEKKKS